MTNSISNCIEKLKFISSVKNVQLRKKLLSGLSDECMYKALQEIANNYIKGNIKLNTGVKRKLIKHNRLLKRLSNKTKNKSIQKRLVVQSGGFLPILIPAVASIITSLIAK